VTQRFRGSCRASRPRAGKCVPAGEGRRSLARFLADDELETDPLKATDVVSSEERRILDLAQRLGLARAAHLLENITFVGYETAIATLARSQQARDRGQSRRRAQSRRQFGAGRSGYGSQPVQLGLRRKRPERGARAVLSCVFRFSGGRGSRRASTPARREPSPSRTRRVIGSRTASAAGSKEYARSAGTW